MLNKKACKICCLRFGHQKWTVDFWTEEDERRWEEGIIYCPFKHKKDSVNYAYHQRVWEEPPEHCPYQLEHVVTE